MGLPHRSRTKSEHHAASNHGAPLAPSWRQGGEMPKTPAALGACPARSELKSKHRETPVTDVAERTSYRAGRAISTNTIPSSALDACFSLGSPGCFLIFLAYLIHHLQGQKNRCSKQLPEHHFISLCQKAYCNICYNSTETIYGDFSTSQM